MWFYCFLILQPAFPRNSISQNGFFACCKNSPTCHSHFVAVQLWRIDFLFGRDRTEPVLHSPVESFADTVYLRAFRLDFEMAYILYCQIQPILMVLPVLTIFRSPVRELAHESQTMLPEERDSTITKAYRQRQSRSPCHTAWQIRFWIKCRWPPADRHARPS